MQPNFNKVFYPDSPFLVPPSTKSLWRLLYSSQALNQHPATAVAGEVRLTIDEHGAFLDTQHEWLTEKFGLSDEDSNDYYFGLFIPPTLIVAAGMYGWLGTEEILETLIPETEENFFDKVSVYVERHLKLASRLASFDLPEPMASAEPIYSHCLFEVYSTNYWYLVGLEASSQLYKSLSRLYDYPFLTPAPS